MKGIFFLTFRKWLSKDAHPSQKFLTELTHWHLEFQSDSFKIVSATKTFNMWSKQPFHCCWCVTEMALDSAGFTSVYRYPSDRDRSLGVYLKSWSQWKLQAQFYGNLVPNAPECFGTWTWPLQKPTLPQITAQASLFWLLSLSVNLEKRWSSNQSKTMFHLSNAKRTWYPNKSLLAQ